MPQEPELLAQRRQNLEELKALGVEPYPRSFHRKHTVSELQSAFGSRTAALLESDPVETVTSGRILAIRGFGKANFLVISDGAARIQVYVREDSVPPRDFAVFKLLDIGDFIGASGTLFRTKTNELTIRAASLTFLSKCLSPLPEKWHGLQDVELRYRQRYLDLAVNPESRRVFETRTKVLSALRAFLDRRGYLEVETPMMQPIAGGALARPFRTHHNALDIDLYLRIAPELYLKRLLVGGIERVYEINRNFRNEGISTQHNPEFTMLEFYEAYSDYQALMDLTEEMMLFVAERAVGSDEVVYAGSTVSFRPPFARLSLRRAAASAAAARLGEEVTEADLRDTGRAARLASRLGIGVDRSAGAGRTAAAIFEELVEPSLVQPTFVYDFPTEISPLSKQKPGDPDTVERFEMFAGGLELANAFSELNDPVEQRRRFEQQLAERQRGDLEAHQMDEDFIRALEYGMPPAAGEGVGIDRLVMILTDRRSIRDVILFPLLRPQSGR
ncbi:MAG: lysine--tRNA ligase [Vicinamibacterales bacterium]